MYRIFADFNALSHGRLPLSFKGSEEDIRRQGIQLRDGLRLIVYDDECEAEGIVVRKSGEWIAQVVEGTLHSIGGS